MASTSAQEENQKAMDNALFKKLQEITIKMPTDHSLYADDVDLFLKLFKVQFEKVQGDTMKKNQRFGQLLIFHARSYKYFPQKLGWVPAAIMRLLEQLGNSLHPYNRRKCAGAVMILRAKGLLLPVPTSQFLLKLMRLQDKELRGTLYHFILNDIRRMNAHHRNNKINQQLRSFIASYLPKHADKTAQRALRLLIDLYKRNIWTDTKTVNTIAQTCFSPSPRTRQAACHFLLQTTMPLDELPDSQDELPNPTDIRARKGIVRQTKGRQKQMQKQKRKAARRLRKKQIQVRTKHTMPIDQLYNAQAFAQRIFNLMGSRNQKYAHKIVYMQLLGRIIWRHQLILLPFYRSLIRYMQPKQKDIPKVMIAFAQSVHELIPQDQISAIVAHIINHFVNDRCSEMTMTIGLNTLRQVFKKLPSVVTQEIMLYLTTYYDYKNKNVSRAAKSVINFVKSYNPHLLPKKFRTSMENQQAEQTRDGPCQRLAGAQLLKEGDGNVPIEFDRVLTDEDFKRIRKLKKKQQQQEEWGNMIDEEAANQDQEQIDEENQEDEYEQQQQEGDEDDQDGEQELQFEDQDGEQIDFEDGQQIQFEDDQQEGEEEQGQDDAQQQIQGQQQQQFSDDDQLQIQEDYQGQFQEIQQEQKVEAKSDKNTNKKQKNDKKSSKNNKKDQEKSQSQQQDSQMQDQQEQNRYGFIEPHQIAFYKMSKGQLKAAKGKVKDQKLKFKHKPKEKKGGTTNRQKKKLKPLMMIRAKKNKIRSNQKQLKTQLKHLKNQLGKVRSNKQAKRMKSKTIKKNK